MKSTALAKSAGKSSASRSGKRAVAVALSIVATLALVSVSSCQKGAQGEDDLAEFLLSLTNEYNAAWETLNLDSISEFHSDDIRYYWRGLLVCASQSEFERHFREDILTVITAYSAETVEPHVEVLGPDAGVVSYGFRGQVVTPDGETQDYSGALSIVFERRDGDWKVVLIHESAPEPGQ